MIKYFFIFFFSIAGISAQLSAPELRCLEVINTGGDVKLTWLPPADPTNSFFGYEVYFSSKALGPFTQVASAVSPISNTSFVHTTTVTTTQTGYYYVTVRSGAAGTATSTSSDTLKTIFLNINTSIPDAIKLTYNTLHDPRLLTTGTTYTIAKEYPVGTWNDFATTPLDFFNDTLDVCLAKISYQVRLPDASGCISKSNIQGGIYSDKHDPYQPTVDSISVLPNGNTILAWKSPKDMDIIMYEIQNLIGGLNTVIDSLQGKNNSFYILQNGAANLDTVGLFVKAIDSCSRGSLVDYAPRTMFLKSFYNHCNFETTLSWTPYRWQKKNGVPTEQLLEYRIYASTDSGATFSRIATTTLTTYTHKNVTTNKNMFYFVRVVNFRQSMTASSNRTSFYSGQVAAPDFIYIKTAPVIKKNTVEVQIYVDPTKRIVSLEVEKSEDGIEYQHVGSLPFGSVATYTFIDEKVETNRKFYYYRCYVRDSCGNIRQKSNIARTILLKIVEDKDNLFLKHLTWTDYIGFSGGVRFYNIYRMVEDAGYFEHVGTTDDSVLSFSDDLEDVAHIGARIEYYVSAYEGDGNIYGLLETCKSNDAPVYQEGRLYVPNAFAPNGKNKTWKPVTHFVDNREYSVTVYNRWGQMVFETRNDEKAWNGENCPPDVYVYVIIYRNSRGEYTEEKGHVMLIR